MYKKSNNLNKLFQKIPHYLPTKKKNNKNYSLLIIEQITLIILTRAIVISEHLYLSLSLYANIIKYSDYIYCLLCDTVKKLQKPILMVSKQTEALMNC